MTEFTSSVNLEQAHTVPPEEVRELGADALKLAFLVDDDDDDALWFEEDKTPEEEAEANQRDKIMQLYDMGVEIPEGENWDGVTAADMRNWYDSLTEEDRTNVDAGREWSANKRDLAAEVKSQIEKTAPELLIGRLPADLEQLLGGEYQLGINQSATESLAEAQATLAQYGGVDMGMYGENLDQRFQIVDSSMPDAAEDAVVYGYYGHREGSPALGKFVAAIPGEDYHDGLPADFWGSNGNHDGNMYRGDTSLAAKYIAGYIDEQGSFHRNANFMKSNVPDLAGLEDADWL